MARRHHYSSSDSSEGEYGEFVRKESENSAKMSESNSSDSERETRNRRRGGRRRSPESPPQRRERVARRSPSDSDVSEREDLDRRVEKERERRKADDYEDDDRRRYDDGRRGTKERDFAMKSSDEEVDRRRRESSGRRERIDSDKEDDGQDKSRSGKREEERFGDRDRDYERRRKSERESRYNNKEYEKRREDNEKRSRGRYGDLEDEEDVDKKLERRDENARHRNGYRRSAGEDQRYRKKGKGTNERDDEKDERKDRRRRSSGQEENDDRGHRRRELEGRNGGREDDKEADYRKERRKERDRDWERERRREDEGKDRRRRKDDTENLVENGSKADERNAKEKGDDAKVTEALKVPKIENLGRSGGVYIPPFKLARMMKEVQDKSSVEYQRMTWDALRKSINGLVNKVNATNIKNIIPELFAENLIRGRGLFCRSCMKSQMASPAFTDVFAALVAVVNTKFAEVGELLLKRIILQLQRAYKRNDKPQLLAAVKFIAHLVNQQVVHELIALELLTILLENPTDDSVEVAVGFVTECGSILQDLCPRGLHGIFERFRGILHEGEIDKRVQFLIEGLFALRKAKFSGYPAVRPELDLVEQEDQLTHEISLSDQIDPEIALDIFKADPNFLETEKKYEELKKSILGEESEDDEAGSDGGSEDEDEDEDEDESDEEEEEQMKIKDETETNLINLRRTIYLTIMSSVDFEEAGHKLLKIKLEPGQEMELCIMLLECCSQERTYLRYYGLLGQRFCMINKVYQENFDTCFAQQYSMIHRLETNKLRNVAKFFAHLLGTYALPWQVLAYIRLTEEDTTSSSRIFIKILFQELSEHLGIRLLNERLNDPTMQEWFVWIFPKDNPKNTRFAINFFTSIGLGGITENLREYLKNMPRLIMQQQKPVSELGDESGNSSSSSGSDSSGSDSESESSSSGESESESDDGRRKRRRRN